MLPLFIMAIENDTDRQFVAGLYQRHRDFLLRCAQKILNDPDRAEEALHEAMLRVIRSLERVRQIPAEELLPYLVTIVQTASIDLYHKTNRERQAAQGPGAGLGREPEQHGGYRTSPHPPGAGRAAAGVPENTAPAGDRPAELRLHAGTVLEGDHPADRPGAGQCAADPDPGPPKSACRLYRERRYEP